MSERGHFRGGRGGGRGDRGGRGGGGGERGGRGGHAQSGAPDKKKENILDLTKYIDKEIIVKFSGGREGMLLPQMVYQMNRADIANSQRNIERLRPTDEFGA